MRQDAKEGLTSCHPCEEAQAAARERGPDSTLDQAAITHRVGWDKSTATAPPAPRPPAARAGRSWEVQQPAGVQGPTPGSDRASSSLLEVHWHPRGQLEVVCREKATRRRRSRRGRRAAGPWPGRSLQPVPGHPFRLPRPTQAARPGRTRPGRTRGPCCRPCSFARRGRRLCILPRRQPRGWSCP